MLPAAEKKKKKKKKEKSVMSEESHGASRDVSLACITHPPYRSVNTVAGRHDFSLIHVDDNSQNLREIPQLTKRHSENSDEDMECFISNLRHACDAALKERDAALCSLSALKRHVSDLEMQDDAKYQWRVDAEVRLALEDFKKHHPREADDKNLLMRDELMEEKDTVVKLELELKRMEMLLEAKDSELSNLNLALGELSFENETRSKQKESRKAMETDLFALRAKYDVNLNVMQSFKRTYLAACDRELRALSLARDAMLAQKEKDSMLATTYACCKKNLNLIEENYETDYADHIDKRVVVQSLSAYFENGCSDEVLHDMGISMGFNAQETVKLRNAVRKAEIRGCIRKHLSPQDVKVSGNAFSKSNAPNSNFAEDWVDYLVKNDNHDCGQ